MVTFRNNNNRRNNFRRNDRNFKSNSERSKFGSNYSNNENFQRKIPGRNNHNASKLIEKYNNLAREVLSSGDKILSENYFQHADHFTRILNEQESFKKNRFSSDPKMDPNISEKITADENKLKEDTKDKVVDKNEESETKSEVAIAK